MGASKPESAIVSAGEPPLRGGEIDDMAAVATGELRGLTDGLTDGLTCGEETKLRRRTGQGPLGPRRIFQEHLRSSPTRVQTEELHFPGTSVQILLTSLRFFTVDGRNHGSGSDKSDL